MLRRHLMRVGIALLMAHGLAHAQSYPAKPIKIVSPVAPGGSADASARTFASYLEKRLGQPVTIEPRPGANQTIGTRSVVGAPPDGYTLYFGTVINPHPLFNKVNGVEPIKELAPISTIMTVPMGVFMSAKAPANNWQELLGYARANPTKVNFASPNVASFLLYVALISDRSGPGGFPVTTIGYKGATEAQTSLVTGESHFTVGGITTYLPQIRAGAIKPLFVMSKSRVSHLQNVPTADEVGLRGLQALVYYGLWAPKGTPNEIIRRLSLDAMAVAKDPDFGAKVVSTLGGNPVGNTPEECLRDAMDDLKLFTEAAALINFKPE